MGDIIGGGPGFAGGNQVPDNQVPGRNIVIHNDPLNMEKEASQRYEHYCLQEEKIEYELARTRTMKAACKAMLEAFQGEERAKPISRDNYVPHPDPY